MSIFKFSKNHALRPVHWRWERARIVAENPKLAVKDTDDYILQAAEFRTNKDKCADELELYELFDKCPNIAMAYDLWDEETISETGRANPMRYEIEARLLANESIDDIASKSQLDSSTIDWYEKLFFNVTDRLHNKMYILHVVIGDAIQRSMSDRDYAILWKLYGYIRGSAMLDFLITTFTDSTKISSEQVAYSLQEDHKLTMKRKSALAARMIGVNGHTQDRLIELYTRIVEIEQEAGDTSSDAISTNIQVMLNHLPLLVGNEISKDSKMKDIANLPAGLRAGELLNIQNDKCDTIDKLKDFEFPKRPKNA